MDKKQTRQPLISVIIPAYNCAATLGRAIDSALMQDPPLEVLVLDNSEPGLHDQVMERYRDDERVRYFHNEKNLGASGSRNRGVSYARGKYVAFLDSDDWWSEGKLKAQLKCMEEKNVVLCSTARELAAPDGTLTGRIIPVRTDITYTDLLRHNCINCSSVMLLTSVAREFPMTCEDSHEDYITWLKILKKYKRAAAINEPMLKYTLSASGKSGSKLHSAGMTYKVYRYSGFGRLASSGLFIVYALNGVYKYLMSYLRKSC